MNYLPGSSQIAAGANALAQCGTAVQALASGTSNLVASVGRGFEWASGALPARTTWNQGFWALLGGFKRYSAGTATPPEGMAASSRRQLREEFTGSPKEPSQVTRLPGHGTALRLDSGFATGYVVSTQLKCPAGAAGASGTATAPDALRAKLAAWKGAVAGYRTSGGLTRANYSAIAARHDLILQIREAAKDADPQLRAQCARAALHAFLPELFKDMGDEEVPEGLQPVMDKLMGIDHVFSLVKSPTYSIDRLLRVLCNLSGARDNAASNPAAAISSLAAKIGWLHDAISFGDVAMLDPLLGKDPELDEMLIASRKLMTARIMGGDAFAGAADKLVNLEVALVRETCRLQRSIQALGREFSLPAEGLRDYGEIIKAARAALGSQAGDSVCLAALEELHRQFLEAAQPYRDTLVALGRDAGIGGGIKEYLACRAEALSAEPPLPGTPAVSAAQRERGCSAIKLSLRGQASFKEVARAEKSVNDVMARIRPHLGGLTVTRVSIGKDEDKSVRVGNKLLQSLVGANATLKTIAASRQKIIDAVGVAEGVHKLALAPRPPGWGDAAGLLDQIKEVFSQLDELDQRQWALKKQPDLGWMDRQTRLAELKPERAALEGELKRLAPQLQAALAERQAFLGDDSCKLLRNVVRIAILAQFAYVPPAQAPGNVPGWNTSAAAPTTLPVNLTVPAEKAGEIKARLRDWGVPVDELAPEIDLMLAETYGPDELSVWNEQAHGPYACDEAAPAEAPEGLAAQADALDKALDRLQLSSRVILKTGLRTDVYSGLWGIPRMKEAIGYNIAVGGKVSANGVNSLVLARGADAYEIYLPSGWEFGAGASQVLSLKTVKSHPDDALGIKYDTVGNLDGSGARCGGVSLRFAPNAAGLDAMKAALKLLIAPPGGRIKLEDLPEGAAIGDYRETRVSVKGGGGGRLGPELQLRTDDQDPNSTEMAAIFSLRLTGAGSLQRTEQSAHGLRGGVSRKFNEGAGELTMGAGPITARTGSALLHRLTSLNAEFGDLSGTKAEWLRTRLKTSTDGDGRVLNGSEREVFMNVINPIAAWETERLCGEPYRHFMETLRGSEDRDQRRLADDIEKLFKSAGDGQMPGVVCTLDEGVQFEVNDLIDQANIKRDTHCASPDAGTRGQALRRQADRLLQPVKAYAPQRMRNLDLNDEGMTQFRTWPGSKGGMSLGATGVQPYTSTSAQGPVADRRPPRRLALDIHRARYAPVDGKQPDPAQAAAPFVARALSANSANESRFPVSTEGHDRKLALLEGLARDLVNAIDAGQGSCENAFKELAHALGMPWGPQGGDDEKYAADSPENAMAQVPLTGAHYAALERVARAYCGPDALEKANSLDAMSAIWQTSLEQHQAMPNAVVIDVTPGSNAPDSLTSI